MHRHIKDITENRRRVKLTVRSMKIKLIDIYFQSAISGYNIINDPIRINETQKHYSLIFPNNHSPVSFSRRSSLRRVRTSEFARSGGPWTRPCKELFAEVLSAK